jgi:hypothetical protein
MTPMHTFAFGPPLLLVLPSDLVAFGGKADLAPTP